MVDRLGSRSVVKLVLGVFPRYTRHVLWGPCKDVPVLMEELDELAFLFADESDPNDATLARLGGIQNNPLAVLGCLKCSLIIRSLGLHARHGCLHLGLAHFHDLVELAPLCIYDKGISQLGAG